MADRASHLRGTLAPPETIRKCRFLGSLRTAVIVRLGHSHPAPGRGINEPKTAFLLGTPCGADVIEALYRRRFRNGLELQADVVQLIASGHPVGVVRASAV